MVGGAGSSAAGDGAELAPWPLQLLDVPGLRQAGVARVPFRQFVLKIHSRCNLACEYCYIYEGADTSWRRRPVRMAPDILRRTVRRISEHAATHGLAGIRVDLHGGEPLLAGPGPLVSAAAQLRAALPPSCVLDITVQTNGTLLTEAVLDRLSAAGIRVGISLDGGTAVLNARRVDHGGRPSWPAVSRAARLLSTRPGTYSGVLATIDVDADPAEVYSSLVSLRPPSMDLLLPHANWTTRPAVGDGEPAPHGRWLRTAFDLWWDAVPAAPPVRLFREIIGLLLGRPGTSEAVGLSPMAALVVDTDGSIEQVDSLKSAYEGATVTGFHVATEALDDVLDHPGVVARQLGSAGLAPQCGRCSLAGVCGGGNYAHRYREGSGYLHPSVYCADLETLIRHVALRLQAALPYTPDRVADLPTTP